MTEAATAPIATSTAAMPWTQRIAETPPWSPWRLAVAIAVGLLVVFSVVELALGRLPLLLASIHDR
jgi:hypothetical protein